jgi:hemoglobin
MNGITSRFYLFLSGWTGGPQLFIEKFGHPRLRMRYFPFSIGRSEADQWMLCMEQALKNIAVAESLAAQLVASFREVADQMRNRED